MRFASLVLVALCLSFVSAGTVAAQDARALGLELVAEIDPESVGAPPFGRIAGLELGSDGSIFVLDALNQRVSVFDSSGRPVRSFGRRGQGPGEMEDPVALFRGPADNLWIADARLGRFTIFSRDGELVGTRRAEGPRPLDPPRFGFSGSGRLLTVGLDFEGGSLEQPRAMFVEAEVGDEVVRQVRQVPLPFVQWPETYDHRGSDISLMILIPFSPEPLFGIDPQGRLWYVDVTDGGVHRWSEPDGWDLSIGSEPEAVPVMDVDIEEVLENNRDVEELRAVAGDAGVQQFVDRIPPVKPRVTAAFFDDRGLLWIMRSRAAQDVAYPVEAYRLDGTLQGADHLPVVPRPHPKVRGGLLVGVARDELGRESIKVYRLSAAYR